MVSVKSSLDFTGEGLGAWSGVEALLIRSQVLDSIPGPVKIDKSECVLTTRPQEVLRGEGASWQEGSSWTGSPVRAWEPGHFTGLSEVRKLNPRVGGGEVRLAPGCLGWTVSAEAFHRWGL